MCSSDLFPSHDKSCSELYTKVTTELTNKIAETTDERELNRLQKKGIGYNMDNAIAAKAVRLFLERWRKKYKRSLRHWLITEIGHNGTENIHLHGIIWTDSEKAATLKELWAYGYIWDGNTRNEKKESYVNAKTVNYITKYITKKTKNTKPTNQ